VSSEHGVAVISRFLEEAGVDHEVVEHDSTFSAVEEAQAAGVEPKEAAKTLLLHDRGGWRLAVIPADRQLDLERVRSLLGGTSHLRLATEDEMRGEFPAFDVGALPPFGPMLPMPEIVDIRLLYRDRVLCAAGDHRHGVRLDPRELLWLAAPRVGDICRHHEPEHRFEELPRV
jgi:Ala-tRNA(Pro) deacylase